MDAFLEGSNLSYVGKLLNTLTILGYSSFYENGEETFLPQFLLAELVTQLYAGI